MNVFITKGCRIRAKWLDAHPTCLSGSQLKFGATLVEVSGVVRHVRGNDPVNPTEIRLYVESDDGLGEPCGKCQVREIAIKANHVYEVIDPDGKKLT